jgi:Protein of Unknown function (DUF2784)
MTFVYSFLADAILVIHALIVFFNLGALPAIWIGHFRGWSFARNFWFRIAHLALIAFIAAESALGAICPLTTWEDQLRLKAGLDPRYHGSFVQHWVHWLLFYNANQRIFTIGYGVFLTLVLITLFVVKPRRPNLRGRNMSTPAA